jgi:hypothetical protein
VLKTAFTAESELPMRFFAAPFLTGFLIAIRIPRDYRCGG